MLTSDLLTSWSPVVVVDVDGSGTNGRSDQSHRADLLEHTIVGRACECSTIGEPPGNGHACGCVAR